MKTFIKNPLLEDKLDYLWEWEDWLDGDTIASVEMTVPEGLTLVGDAVIVDSITVLTWISGGTLTRSYVVACKITTDEGRTKTRRARFDIKEH